VLPQELAQELTKSNLPLMPLTVVDARLATGQDSSQMFLELNVLPDHLLSAMIALPDNLPMDTPVRNAQLDKLLIQTTSSNATDQPAQDNIKSNLLTTTSTVEDARPANSHNTCQMPLETNASLDH
jgi:hypothetical protein